MLLLALGKARAARLLKKFDAEELKLLTRSAADLRPVRMSDLETLVEEFAQTFSNGVGFAGTVTEVKNLLSDVMTEEQFAEVLAEAPREGGAGLGARCRAQGRIRCAATSARSIRKPWRSSCRGSIRSSPPTSSARLPPRPATACCAGWSPSRGSRDDAVRAVGGRAAGGSAGGDSSTNSHVGIADILNRLDKTQSEEVLKSLAEVRPEEAKAIKSMLFTFEDVAKLPQQARTMVFDQVPIERLVIALKGTEPDFQAAILSSLASRSRRMVEAELQGGGTPSPRDLAEARRTIVATVLKMIAKGDIRLEAGRRRRRGKRLGLSSQWPRAADKESKTEEPTEKKIRDAAREGQCALLPRGRNARVAARHPRRSPASSSSAASRTSRPRCTA